ncbi:hypothetical protein ZWY2020_049677 [Hordeum vulgare]|nr:hypothetical protein ZWY2020_049677 [Hordeum vulgare]
MAGTDKPKAKPQKPAKVTAARIAKMMAEGAAMIRNMTPEERDMIIAKSMSEESASNADEAAEAKEDANESEWAQCEGELFAAKFRSFWNKYYTDCGATFEQTTSIPAMCHTYPASDCSTKAMDTLQIMSVKVTSIKDGLGLDWPLEVFGIVAARDVLDHKRNIIFHRPRTDCQIITQDDCYLALTGPTRAIAVSVDPSYIEVSLKVKGTTEAEDTDLSDLVLMYRTGCCPGSVFPSRLSTLEIEFRHINRSVEATVHIKVIGGSWPDGFHGEFSAGISSSDDLQVKLLDFEDGGLPVNADGEIKLSRRMVSVGVESNLKVSVRARPINKDHAAESSEAVLKCQRAGTSPSGIKLSVGSCNMEVSVAWSCFRRAW